MCMCIYIYIYPHIFFSDIYSYTASRQEKNGKTTSFGNMFGVFEEGFGGCLGVFLGGFWTVLGGVLRRLLRVI